VQTRILWADDGEGDGSVAEIDGDYTGGGEFEQSWQKPLTATKVATAPAAVTPVDSPIVTPAVFPAVAPTVSPIVTPAVC